MNIGTGGELADLPAPRGEDLVALTGIRAETDRPADMVEYDRCLWEGTRQVIEIAELRVYIQASKPGPNGASRARPSLAMPRSSYWQTSPTYTTTLYNQDALCYFVVAQIGEKQLHPRKTSDSLQSPPRNRIRLGLVAPAWARSLG
jgi:hypothetical protein